MAGYQDGRGGQSGSSLAASQFSREGILSYCAKADIAGDSDAPVNVASGAHIDIASDDPTPADMAAALSDRLGREVLLRTVEPDQIGSADMRAMFRFLSETGYAADLTSLHAIYPQVGWQTFAQWVDEALRPPTTQKPRPKCSLGCLCAAVSIAISA
ncbi:hypothetical protein [Rhodococcus tibetensis]|uniref:Uncharacterized protein n=1 Tax=Rhodococcus tibetensis TaxID=2965064 RepID=A0ABT1Q838_9NOCA|nr:hypothetical protein [Rhodococcus sp. FXJ9.536]MCQ4118415.1 hypothetical protein [Rhodococcus sp. FXJ9.536]